MAPVSTTDWDELVGHLTRTTTLAPPAAARIVHEVLAYFSETADEFVRRRHRELQAAGRANPDIFATIAAELSGRRVAAPVLTERQIRRLIYG